MLSPTIHKALCEALRGGQQGARDAQDFALRLQCKLMSQSQEGEQITVN